LGGVKIPHETGLTGHSDGDAIAHAITDALLGAAAMGDIGAIFPDTDPKWLGADSLKMLREAVRRLDAGGYYVVNVDVTVITEAPKIGPHAKEIRAKLAGVLGVGVDSVSVKGKTNEGMGPVGRREGLEVHAVASIAEA